MNPHPDFQELQAFTARKLQPAAMLRLNRHLADCETCQARLAGMQNDSGTTALRAVIAAGAHLSYEQLRDHIDDRSNAAQRTNIAAHITLCPLCRRELDDLQRHAAALRQPVAPKLTPQRDGFRRWWQWLPAAAAASLVTVVTLTLVLHPDETTHQSSGEYAATQGLADPQPQLHHDALDHLASISPAAAAAWQARDYARLVDLLRPLTDQRQPAALSALASLYAQGLGVPKDLHMAEQLWQRAADLGQPGAKENARAVRAMIGKEQ
jgi:TPR repeat protein